VTTVVPGANPDTVETQVTKPIEDVVGALQNIDTISSTSSQGVSSVQVQFTTAANADLISVDVERAVSSAAGRSCGSAAGGTRASNAWTLAISGCWAACCTAVCWADTLACAGR
jgi:AcrB/AcrD/AcrF family